jgi:hypothetical protein
MTEQYKTDLSFAIAGKTYKKVEEAFSVIRIFVSDPKYFLIKNKKRP